MNKTILICDYHQDEYPTPLISTLAFRQAEKWCPYCGTAIGMFDGGKNITWTQKLQDRHDKYKEKYSEYLSANGKSYCSSLLWKGERISPHDLPQEEKDRLNYIRQTAWQEGLKIEEEFAK